MIFPSQRREGRLLGYALSTVPSGLIYAQIVLMSTPKTSPTGVITSPGEDLSQPGLTQYMLDVIFVTWAAQTLAIVWSKAWLLYLSVGAVLSNQGCALKLDLHRYLYMLATKFSG